MSGIGWQYPDAVEVSGEKGDRGEAAAVLACVSWAIASRGFRVMRFLYREFFGLMQS
ncbi:MAG: hypothetical protein AAFY26_17180 [Cyanobacteria bacterium J06638_22]